MTAPVSGSSAVYAIIGDPVSHSLSPRMHNAAFAALGIDAVYVPFRVAGAELASGVQALRTLGVRGVNVTIPHKEQVCQFLDEIDAGAQVVGAVNTIVNDNGYLKGYNTDGDGLVRSLQKDLGYSVGPTTRALILGAGGAARGGIAAMARCGAARLVIANRSVARAQELVARFAPLFPACEFIAMALADENLVAEVEKSELIINSTSLGLSGESFNVLPWHAIKAETVLYDMIYAAADTPFTASARRYGLRVCGGLGMLVEQGALAFNLWLGRDAGEIMRAAVGMTAVCGG